MTLNVEETKSLLASKTVWSAIIAALPTIASWAAAFGYAGLSTLIDPISSILTGVGTICAIFFRATATKKIG